MHEEYQLDNGFLKNLLVMDFPQYLDHCAVESQVGEICQVSGMLMGMQRLTSAAGDDSLGL